MGRTRERWEPPAEALSHFPAISGKTVSGLDESERRPPSPLAGAARSPRRACPTRERRAAATELDHTA